MKVPGTQIGPSRKTSPVIPALALLECPPGPLTLTRISLSAKLSPNGTASLVNRDVYQMNDQIVEFDAWTRILQDICETKIHFNKVLGLRVESLKPSCIRVRFDMREELIGNYVKGILHGGVISATLDATGGLVASIDLLKKLAGRPMEEIEERMSRVGTIDLRIDFLRPGVGRYFLASGEVMRGGMRVTVTRMELRNDEDILIAVGTGTYLVG